MSQQRTCPSCGHALDRPGAFCSRCGAPLGELTSPRPSPSTPTATGAPARKGAWEVILERLQGALAPRYRVIRLLGSGGMAGVYLAEETRLGRKVAIKVISPALMVDPSQVERFEQEARTTAQLDHPNVVTVFEVDEREGLHFFTMTHVPGRTLSQVLREAAVPLELRIVRAWLGQIASALVYAHRHGVVHRDIKPGNVLLDEAGNALVGDFGIAKVQDQEGLTRTGMLVGTPAYMSPEQCTTGIVTGASDQYSLGAVAYQMITGQPPFEGPTVAVIHAHMSTAPRPIRELRPECPAELEAAVLRMLAKRPEDRFPRLEAALDALSGGPLRYDDPARERMAELSRWTEGITVGVEPSTITETPLAPGERFRIRAVARAGDGTPLPDRRVEWYTDPGEILEVSADGSVLAVRSGYASVVARTVDGLTEQVDVTVETPRTAGAGPVAFQPADPTWLRVPDDITTIGAPADAASEPDLAPPSPAAPVEPAEPVVAAPSEDPTPAPASAVPPRGWQTLLDPANRAYAYAAGGLASVGVIALIAWLALGSGEAPGTEPVGDPSGAGATVAAQPSGTEQADPAGAQAGTSASGDPAETSVSPDPGGAQPPIADPEPADPPPVERTEVPAPAAAADPEPGILTIGGRLPAGATLQVTGNGVQRSLAGGATTLPPGTYAITGSAPGYERVTGSVQVREGESTEWSANWVQTPVVEPEPSAPADPQPAAPEGPSPAEDRAAVIGTMRAFADALVARDISALRAIYPGIPEPDAARWQAFFATRELRDLRAEATPRGEPTVEGDRAELRFDLTLRYTVPGGAAPAQPVPYLALMTRSGDGWVIERLEQVD